MTKTCLNLAKVPVSSCSGSHQFTETNLSILREYYLCVRHSVSHVCRVVPLQTAPGEVSIGFGSHGSCGRYGEFGSDLAEPAKP